MAEGENQDTYKVLFDGDGGDEEVMKDDPEELNHTRYFLQETPCKAGVNRLFCSVQIPLPQNPLHQSLFPFFEIQSPSDQARPRTLAVILRQPFNIYFHFPLRIPGSFLLPLTYPCLVFSRDSSLVYENVSISSRRRSRIQSTLRNIRHLVQRPGPQSTAWRRKEPGNVQRHPANVSKYSGYISLGSRVW